MGVRRDRLDLWIADQVASRRDNSPAKVAERVRRLARLKKAISEGKFPYIPTVQSWISAETGVPFSQLTADEVEKWAKSL
ncbi:MAG: hypothetical protein KJS91_08895 [Planctomycetes bacterium]|jgi:hypothetical protein|nr:hypothetical protein [Planctomycetota bacterium]